MAARQAAIRTGACLLTSLTNGLLLLKRVTAAFQGDDLCRIPTAVTGDLGDLPDYSSHVLFRQPENDSPFSAKQSESIENATFAVKSNFGGCCTSSVVLSVDMFSVPHCPMTCFTKTLLYFLETTCALSVSFKTVLLREAGSGYCRGYN